ncbi:chitin-binding like protein, putative [Trypanosoma cruzi]|uniref:Chitin-binding like protein, putative n=1 Tax=Trypanosoma cruzi (strain CL Brener) TaxID=353153 RepID=Q4DY90_TRYCC|nr:chitin-binding like protein, putative [Trypanosoma cruzi]EAN97495.1 chitin-binding like protein, putative [Trypanosoma cruzi]|eukprot:XP_819346.1 chitin-binding like protein [Trypanosoma cruzi strain CL Brener]
MRCVIEGVWDKCAWILAQHLHVPKCFSRCTCTHEGFSGCAGRCAMDSSGRDNSKTTGGSACGRCSVCADAWRKHPLWLLLLVAVAVCSRCTVLPSRSVCLCA